MKTGPKPKPIKDRFETKFIPEPMSGCWLWEGKVGNSGYGAIGTGGRGTPEIGAHRASFLIYCDEIPAGLQVLHKCDNKLCVNPGHLFVGTQSENLYDMARKGRYVGNRQLSVEQARDIKRRLAAGERRSSIAKTFNVSASTITHIANGRRWASVSLAS